MGGREKNFHSLIIPIDVQNEDKKIGSLRVTTVIQIYTPGDQDLFSCADEAYSLFNFHGNSTPQTRAAKPNKDDDSC